MEAHRQSFSVFDACCEEYPSWLTKRTQKILVTTGGKTKSKVFGVFFTSAQLTIKFVSGNGSLLESQKCVFDCQQEESAVCATRSSS